MEYIVIIERAADGSFSAYLPDLPGCVACGDSPDEVRRKLHLESMKAHGEPIPVPTTTVDRVKAA